MKKATYINSPQSSIHSKQDDEWYYSAYSSIRDRFWLAKTHCMLRLPIQEIVGGNVFRLYNNDTIKL